MFSDETYRAVLVAAIEAHGTTESLAVVIKETVGALIAADLELLKHQSTVSQ